MSNTLKLRGNFTSPVEISSALTVGTKITDTAYPSIAFNGTNQQLTVTESGSVHFNTSRGAANFFIGGQPLATLIQSIQSFYSAVEVHPTNADIAAGTVDEVTGLEYKTAVPANMMCGLIIRSMQPQSEQNVVIDWGDGTRTELGSVTPSTEPLTDATADDAVYFPALQYGETNIQVAHKYTTPGRYIVKILGNTYWGFHTGVFASGKSLVSRVFDRDLPIAECVIDLASLANGSSRIQGIEVPNYYKLTEIINISGAFTNCTNLLKAVGFSGDAGTKPTTTAKLCFNKAIYAASGMFTGCTNLQSCDATIPKTVTSLASGMTKFFINCSNLEANVLKLIPESGFCDRYVNIDSAFQNCAKLTCSDYAKLANLLWLDTSKVWQNTSGVFSGCSDEFRSHVPTTWGGTATA